MNILLIAPSFPPKTGGIENLMYNLAKNSSHNITVLTGQADEEIDTEFEVIRRNFEGQSGLWTALKFIIKNRSDYDLIYFGSPLYSFLGYITNSDYVVHTYARELIPVIKRQRTKIRLFMLKKGLQNADKVFSISKWTKEKVKDHGVDEEKINIVHPGIGKAILDKNKNPKNQDFLRNKLETDKPILLTISRLDPRKGHKLVIEAIENLDCHYLIGGSGQAEQELKEKTKQLGLEDRIHFEGFIPEEEKHLYYQSCDIFTMPSTFIEDEGNIEGFGIVYLEANSAYKPVIGSNTGGIPSAIKNEETGLIVEPETEELRKAISKLLEDDKKRTEMGEKGRKWAEKHDWENIIQKIDRVLAK